MFKHNLLIALRNLRRHKGSFIINLIGLSTGLACTLLIFLWVSDELSVDKFHKNDSRLYQVLELSKENGNIIMHDGTQGPLAAAMATDLPEVQKAVSVLSLEKVGIRVPLKAGEKVIKGNGLFAGKDMFNIFTFPFLKGNATTALSQKESIVLSNRMAKILFTTPEQAMGKTIEWEILGNKFQGVVSGVLADMPRANSMNFDFALSYDRLYYDVAPNLQKWWNEGPSTYLLMKPGTDMAKFNAKIKMFINKYLPDNEFTLFTRSYSDAYLHGTYENGVQTGGRIEYVKLFSIVAIIILAIACINFMNLSTARASRRLKEVGIKKAIGSTRRALVLQFLSEAVFMAFASLLVAVIVVLLVLPVFNQITGKQLSIQFDPRLISAAVLITLVTGLLSGSYPAFYMSGFDVVSVFKGKMKKSVGELLARKGLVVFQFMVSLILMVSVMVIYDQIKYVQSKNLGFDRDNVIQFSKDGNIHSNPTAFLTELKKLPGVKKAAMMQEGILNSQGSSSTYGIDWPGKTDKDRIDFGIRAVDYDLLELLDIKIKEGRSFSRDFGSDTSILVFNETAIKMMGLKNPIGTKVNMWGNNMTIGGVVKDFHVSSFHDKIAPMVFYFFPDRTTKILAKIEAGKEKTTISAINALFSRFNPGYVFEYTFLDDSYRQQYVSEDRISTLSKYFAGLAIIISCLGLFGLAAFNAEVRTKEIGIRKVLGASVSNVMMMLSKDFIKLIAISMVVAFPLAWWIMNAWLNSFEYRVNIGSKVFVLAGISIILLALLTVGYQSIKSALMNPVNSLRTE